MILVVSSGPKRTTTQDEKRLGKQIHSLALKPIERYLSWRGFLVERFTSTERRKVENDLSPPRHEEVWLTFFVMKNIKGLQSSSFKRLRPNKDICLIFALVGRV